MVNFDSVKKQKRKRISAIVTLASTITVAVLIIIAFLGSTLGSFTVQIKTAEDLTIAVSDKSSFANPSTYLRVGDVPQIDIYSNYYLTDHDKLDSEDTDFLYGAVKDPEGNNKYLRFFKYTFFLKNTCQKPMGYLFNLNIIENVKPTNVNYDLTDILRIRLYSNEDDSHEYESYAKRSRTPHEDEHGEISYKEALCSKPGTLHYAGYAEEFYSDTIIINKEYVDFNPNEVRRYTVVMWLEGEDPECSGTQPENCSVKLGVNIGAHENR